MHMIDKVVNLVIRNRMIEVSILTGYMNQVAIFLMVFVFINHCCLVLCFILFITISLTF